MTPALRTTLTLGLLLAALGSPFLVTREANAAPEAAFSCSDNLRNWKKKAQHQKYAAFAKGKAFTITGMMGCGFSWGQKSQAAADALAIKHCREKAKNPDKCFISDRTKLK